MTETAGDLLLQVFETYDIEYIFSSPGTEWVSVWEGLAKRLAQGKETPRYINCRHEGLAVSAAAGYSKTTGRLTAVLLHAGIGPLHCAMEIRSAHRARVPMIICTGITSDYGEKGAGLTWQWLGRLSDLGGADAGIRPYVKWSNSATSRKSLLDALYRGCQIARTPPQGPVFLSIPWELLLEECSATSIPQPSSPVAPPQPDSGAVEEVARLLVASRRPIIITEHAGKSPETVSKLVELVELLSIPVCECVDPAYTNFPPSHPLHMGYDSSQALREADVVFIVGAQTPWHPPSAFPSSGVKVISLDDDSSKEQLPYWGYRVDLSITADIGQCLDKLTNVIQTYIRRPNWSSAHCQERFEYWQGKHEQIMKKWESEALAEQMNKPISAKWFLYLANKVLPDNAIILNETVSHSGLLRRYMVQTGSHLRVSSGGLGTGLGFAAGVKLAYQDRPIVLFIGDGTFNYNPVLAGLGLYQEYHLPVLIIILNNHGYTSMKGSHCNIYPHGSAVSNNTYFGADILPDPDYVRVAQAFDAYGEKIEEPQGIEPALNRALQHVAMGKTSLLDVILSS